jgi:hypothetical protein
MAISFGVVAGATCGYGTVNSAEKAQTAAIAEARNTVGVVTNQQAYSRTTTAKLTAILTDTAPLAGAALTIYGVAGLASSVRQIENNTTYATIEAETTVSDAATLVALGA